MAKKPVTTETTGDLVAAGPKPEVQATLEQIQLATQVICDIVGCGRVEATARLAADSTLAISIAELEAAGNRSKIVQLLF